MPKNLTHHLKLCLMSGVALSLMACSSLDTSPNAEGTHASPDHAQHSSNYPSNTQSDPQNSQGRPLWIWIAPRYRADMPEGTGEYLIETI